MTDRAQRWEGLRRRTTVTDLALPLLVFALGRIVSGVLLVHLAVKAYDPAVGDRVGAFEGRDLPGVDYGSVVAYWDGYWYEQIARHGYPGSLPTADGEVVQNPWAFFPLYPALVAMVMRLGLDFGTAGSAVSLACSAAAMVLLHHLLAPRLGRFSSLVTVTALSWAPFSPIFQATYTEGPALLLVLGTFWFVRRRRYGPAAVTVLVLAFTRPVSAPLALVLALLWWLRHRERATRPFPRPERVKHAALVGLTGLSAAFWPLTCAAVTGQLDAYAQTQQAWIFTPEWTTWLQSALSLDRPGHTAIVMSVLILCGWFAWRPESAGWGPDLRAWLVANTAYILAISQATTSLFRYLALGVVLVWPVPELSSAARRAPARIALVAALLLVLVPLQYAWIRAFYTSATLPP